MLTRPAVCNSTPSCAFSGIPFVRTEDSLAHVDQGFKQLGLPWFSRQILLSLTSKVQYNDTGSAFEEIVLGSFLNFDFSSVTGIVCPYATTTRRWSAHGFSIDGNGRSPSLANKANCKFVDTHSFKKSPDGRQVAFEMLKVEPRQVFDSRVMISTGLSAVMLDSSALESWFRQHAEYDESGLAKAPLTRCSR